jgi:hypothetical protein
MKHIGEVSAQYLDLLRLAPRNHDFEAAVDPAFCRVCDTPKSTHEDRA